MNPFGAIDFAVVLGSGLSRALETAVKPERRIAYKDIPGMPARALAGHAGEALLATWHGKRALIFAGRAHLYQGFSAREVTHGVALAAGAGARVLLQTNAAGGLNERFAAGDLMLIADHLNLTGENPLVGADLADPFVDMTRAYSPRLRALAHECSQGAYSPLHDGIYAGVRGPSYETPAETTYLRSIGADAVGMSTVLETIVARARGMEVLGLSLITNVAGARETSHGEVTAVAAASAARLANLLDRVAAAM